MSVLLMIKMEHQKAARSYEHDAQRIKRARDPYDVASVLRLNHGASWAMMESSPEVRHAKKKRLDAAGERLDELFANSPTVEMAKKCWEVSRGDLPKHARKFYDEMTRLMKKPGGPGSSMGM